jgi:antitoxin (DNA-binding transcriptional repressor) of toxin-antitoxin stability system
MPETDSKTLEIDALGPAAETIREMIRNGEKVNIVEDKRIVAEVVPLQGHRNKHNLLEFLRTAPRLTPSDAEDFANDLHDLWKSVRASSTTPAWE